MSVGFAPQMSHLLARDSVEQEEQWLHRSKVLQSVGSFNTRMGKSISPQQAQYEVSIATQWLHRSKVLQTAGSLDTRMCKRSSPQLSQYEVSIAARMGVVTKRMVLMAALLYCCIICLRGCFPPSSMSSSMSASYDVRLWLFWLLLRLTFLLLLLLLLTFLPSTCLLLSYLMFSLQ